MANSKKKPDNKVASSEVNTAKKRGRPPKAASAPPEVSKVKMAKFQRMFKYKYRILTAITILLIAALPSAYFYNKYQDSKAASEDSAQVEKEEAMKLVTEVREHALLPTDEEPTVATVSDISKLQGQAFFLDAANGDKVLVYSNAKKVVLYRPSIQRVINMTPLNLEPTGATPPAETPAQ